MSVKKSAFFANDTSAALGTARGPVACASPEKYGPSSARALAYTSPLTAHFMKPIAASSAKLAPSASFTARFAYSSADARPEPGASP